MREAARRAELSRWLSGYYERYDLSDSGIAVAMLRRERRASLAGPVAWAAQRSRVRKWRLGGAGLKADSAFALGEALGELGIPGMSGFYSAYRLGFAAPLGRALVALGEYDGARFGHVALALYSALPIFAENVARARPASDYGQMLRDAPLGTVENVKKAAGVCLEECKLLFDCASASIGGAYRAVWDQRGALTQESLCSGELDFLDQSESERLNRDESRILQHDVFFAWRLLLDWAVNSLQSLPGLDSRERAECEFGLMSLSLVSTAGSHFDRAKAALLKVLRGSLEATPVQTHTNVQPRARRTR